MNEKLIKFTLPSFDQNESPIGASSKARILVAEDDPVSRTLISNRLEICRRMRESGRSVYIIMLTARGTKKDAVEDMDHGADDYLIKPFDPDELLARIRAGLRQLNTHLALETRVNDLQTAIVETKTPKLQLPL